MYRVSTLVTESPNFKVTKVLIYILECKKNQTKKDSIEPIFFDGIMPNVLVWEHLSGPFLLVFRPASLVIYRDVNKGIVQQRVLIIYKYLIERPMNNIVNPKPNPLSVQDKSISKIPRTKISYVYSLWRSKPLRYLVLSSLFSSILVVSSCMHLEFSSVTYITNEMHIYFK